MLEDTDIKKSKPTWKKSTLRFSDECWAWINKEKGAKSATAFLTSIIHKSKDNQGDIHCKVNDANILIEKEDAYKEEIESLSARVDELIDKEKEVDELNLIIDGLNALKHNNGLPSNSDISMLAIDEEKKSLMLKVIELEEADKVRNKKFLDINDELMAKRISDSSQEELMDNLSESNNDLAKENKILNEDLDTKEGILKSLNEMLSKAEVELNDAKNNVLASFNKITELESSNLNLKKALDDSELKNKNLEKVIEDNNEDFGLKKQILQSELDQAKKINENVEMDQAKNKESNNSLQESIRDKSIRIAELNEKEKSLTSENIQLEIKSNEGSQALLDNVDFQDKLDLLSDRYKTMKENFNKVKVSRDTVKKDLSGRIDRKDIEIKTAKKKVMILLVAFAFSLITSVAVTYIISH